jgi:FKBP-type peptidyl-prolyl cis-trans isomerase 2
MAVKKGNFVKMEYTGKLPDGTVFDTSSEKIAKERGIYSKDRVYSPLLVSVGSGDVIKGIDEALAGMEKGDKKEITVAPEKGYGLRNPKLIKIIPITVFTRNKISPVPGMVVNLDGMPAKVQSVSGGRVRVDFNHELAGRTLVFNIDVKDVVTKTDAKIRALIEDSFGKDGLKHMKFKLQKGKVLTVSPDKEIVKRKEYTSLKGTFINSVLARMKDDVEKVNFEESFSR